MSPRYRDNRPTDDLWCPLDLDDSRYAQSLIRGLAILGSFSPARPVLGIKDIASSLGMSSSTTHRYVVTLTALGYLEQLRDRRYRLGLRVLDLGMSVLGSSDLRGHASPYLQELRQRTGYTVSIAVLDGTEILLVDRVRSSKRGQHQIGHDVSVGSRLPAYCTAMGKILLAGITDPDRNELIYEFDLKRRGPNTITSKKALRAELERIADADIAIDDQESREGLIAIATRVRDGNREVVASVGLEAHKSMISAEGLVDAFAAHLMSTADQISARLGHRRDDELVKQ